MLSSVVSSPQQELLRALREKLIPWAQVAGVRHTLLAEPPWRVPLGVRAVPHEMPPLRGLRQRYQYPFPWLEHWGDRRMKASHHPYIGCVLEGEADQRFAVPQKRWKHFPAMQPDEHCRMVSLLQHSVFIVPPGIAYDGTMPHWWRPQPENARSPIFWIHPLPAGAAIHTCATHGKDHSFQCTLFVIDSDLLPMPKTRRKQSYRNCRPSARCANRR